MMTELRQGNDRNAQRLKVGVAGMAILASVSVGLFILRSQAAPDVLGDLDGDGKVTKNDVIILSNNLNKSPAIPKDGDLDGDNDVDISDLSVLANKVEQ